MLQIRNRRSTIVQLCTPAIFVIVLFLLELAIESNTAFYDFFDVVRHQKDESIKAIPHCVTGVHVEKCWTFAYAPNTSDIRMIVDRVSIRLFVFFSTCLGG